MNLLKLKICLVSYIQTFPKLSIGITNATTFVAKNNIETFEELDSKINDLNNQLNELQNQRKQLYSKSYIENNLIEKAKLSDSAKRLTPEIKELRNDIKSLEYFKDHSQRCIDYNKELERKKKKLERRNIN